VRKPVEKRASPPAFERRDTGEKGLLLVASWNTDYESGLTFRRIREGVWKRPEAGVFSAR
jgi:hypothetical protein